MREILFRGKRLDNGEWAESIYPYGVIHSGVVAANFVPATVGQYTGLTDHNGKRIFEGDVVRWTWEKQKIIGFQSCQYDGHYYGAFLVVRWTEAGFMLCPLGDTMPDAPSAGAKVDNYSFWNFHGGLEITGNIHDNLELLEGAAT